MFNWDMNIVVTYLFLCVCVGEGRSELDELQEEVARRARQHELQRKKEKEREAEQGFNPRPSKFMDLDELQHQGKYHTGPNSQKPNERS